MVRLPDRDWLRKFFGQNSDNQDRSYNLRLLFRSSTMRPRWAFPYSPLPLSRLHIALTPSRPAGFETLNRVALGLSRPELGYGRLPRPIALWLPETRFHSARLCCKLPHSAGYGNRLFTRSPANTARTRQPMRPLSRGALFPRRLRNGYSLSRRRVSLAPSRERRAPHSPRAGRAGRCRW